MKIKEFDSFEELNEFAKEHGVDLTEIDLEKVNGGAEGTGEIPSGWKPPKCPNCGSNNIKILYADPELNIVFLECKDCGKRYYARYF